MGNIWCIGQRIDSIVTNCVISTSIDGVTWNTLDTSLRPFSNVALETGSTLTWSGNMLIAGSTLGDISVTTDFETWTTGSLGVTGFNITGLISPPTFMAAGRRHYLSSNNPETQPLGAEVAQIFRSPSGLPGTYFLIFGSQIDPSGFNNIKYFPAADTGTGGLSAVIVAVGDQNMDPYVVYSVDGGVTWAVLSIDSGLTDPFYDVDYNISNKMWYFGTRNSIAIATNLISPTWTTTINFGNKLSEVTKLLFNPDGQMVAVTPAALWWSDNLENWNQFSLPGYSWQSIFWYNNRWIAGSYGQLTQFTFWFSFDMLNWFPENNQVQPRAFTVSLGPSIQYWINLLGGPGTDQTFGMSTDSAGNSYITGGTDQGGAGLNVSLAKYDIQGNLVWQRSLSGAGNENGIDIAVDTNTGSLFLVGMTTSQGAGSTDMLFVKYNEAGVLQWQKAMGQSLVDSANGVGYDSNGNSYVGGYTTDLSTGFADPVLIKFLPDGTIDWQMLLKGPGIEMFNDITVTEDDLIYGAGMTNSGVAVGLDMLLAKYDLDGNLMWQTLFGGTGTDVATAVEVDSTGNVYIAGQTNSLGNSAPDALLVKFSSDGVLIWQKALSDGFNSTEFWKDLTFDDANNVYCVGTTNGEGEGGMDMLIAKYDSDGNLLWQRLLGGTGADDEGYGVQMDAASNLYISGYTNSQGGAYKCVTAKVPSDGSLTGAYSNLVYQVASLNDVTPTLAQMPSMLVPTTVVLTETTTTLTNVATTFANVTFIMN